MTPLFNDTANNFTSTMAEDVITQTVGYIGNALPSLILVLCIVAVIISIGFAITKFIGISISGENEEQEEQEIIQPKIKKQKSHKQTYLEYVQERKEIERLIQT